MNNVDYQDKVSDSYEACCDRCRDLNEQIDLRRWEIGDYALLVETKYGSHTMDDFSRDIGQNKSTVNGWKRVSAFYPKKIRADLFEAHPNLTYTFFKDALRLEALDEALMWLDEVSKEGWSADQAARELTEKLGRHTTESIPGMIEKVFRRDGKCMIEISIGVDDEESVLHAHSVTIKTKQ